MDKQEGQGDIIERIEAEINNVNFTKDITQMLQKI